MLEGKNLIDGKWATSSQIKTSPDIKGYNYSLATAEQVDAACRAAAEAFRIYGAIPVEKRADFLNTIADEINAIGDEITDVAKRETGLPEARLNGERARTTGQLKFFAKLITSPDFPLTHRDAALPNQTPAPRPDIRLTHIPLGPVVVFGASNFPLAFSTAGGDTGSALAAGCTVIVKGHEAHPATGELVAQAIYKAIKKCGMPEACFQLLQGEGRVIGKQLVNHPHIKAVSFTGSLGGGRALYDQCHSRPVPIPFYGELGSVNPVFCLPAALEKRAEEVGKGWAASLILGAGQFCTNPGVIIGLAGEGLTRMHEAAIAAIEKTEPQKMLTDNIYSAYEQGVERLRHVIGNISQTGKATKPRYANAAVFITDAQTWMNTPHIQEEVFGAAGVVVNCRSENEMLTLAHQLEGQLTATMQLEPEDYDFARKLTPILEEKAGRVLCNGFSTGVEVCMSMMHGGPYPASTDARATSVGGLAINRWLRPVSYQNFPKELLRNELQ